MTMMMKIATMTKTMMATATTTMKMKGDYSHDNKYIYVIHHCLWMALIKNGSHNNQPKTIRTVDDDDDDDDDKYNESDEDAGQGRWQMAHHGGS
jgi:hypothetical protein